MLSSLKNEEVWQNCFVFGVANLKLRKSRRIASFLMLSTLKNEDASQFLMLSSNLRTSGRIASFSSLQIDR